MACTEKRAETLMEYLYDECPDRVEFERHLSECESCRRELEQLRGVTATLRNADEGLSTTFLAPRLKARLHEVHARNNRSLFRSPRILALASIAAILVVMAIVMPRFPGGDRGTGMAASNENLAAMLDQAGRLVDAGRDEEALAILKPILEGNPDPKTQATARDLANEAAKRLNREAEVASWGTATKSKEK